MKISTAEIKKYIKECISTEVDCTPQDFCQYIKQHSSKEFTKGQISGGIAQLIDSGELIRIERGLYKSGKSEQQKAEVSSKELNFHGNSKFAAEIGICLESTVKKLSNITEKTDVLNMNKDEFSLLVDIKRIKEELEQLSLKCKQ